MKTTNIPGRFQKSGTIVSNDPGARDFPLFLTGEVKNYVRIKPSPYVMLIVDEGQESSKELEFTADEAAGNVEFSEVDVDEQLKDHIRTKLERGADKRSYKMEITALPGPIGAYGGYITIHTNLDKKPKIPVKVTMSVRGAIQITPTAVNYGTLRGPQEARRLRRPVLLKKVAGDDFAISEVTYNHDSLNVEVLKRKPGKEYLVYVSLNTGTVGEGKLQQEVVIHTTHPRMKTITIPVTAFILGSLQEKVDSKM